MKKRFLAIALSVLCMVNFGVDYSAMAAQNGGDDLEDLVLVTESSYDSMELSGNETEEDLIYGQMEVNQELYLAATSEGFTDAQINTFANAINAGPGVTTDVSSAGVLQEDLSEIFALAGRKADIGMSLYGSAYYYSYYMTSDRKITSITINSYSDITLEEFKIKYKLLSDKLNEIVAGVPANLTRNEKALYVHDYLAYSVAYDYENYVAGTIPSLSYSMYGALVDGVAVCAGYSYAYRAIMDRLGIECEYVTSDEVNHAWNVVKLNDGKWYQLDATWDDPVYNAPIYDKMGYCSHKYFFMNDTQWSSSEHGSDWKESIPDITCDGTKYESSDFSRITSRCYYINNQWYFILDNAICKGNPLTLTGTKINSVSRAELLGYYGNRLYYASYGDIYSCALDGSDIVDISDELGEAGYVKEMKVDDGYLYYSVSNSSVVKMYKLEAEYSELEVTGTLSASTIKAGKTLTITGNASGGTGDYTYSYLVYNPDTNAWYRFNKTFTTSNTYNWTASGSGSRIFYVEAKDGNGTVVRSSGLKVAISSGKDLSVIATGDKSIVTAGEKVTIKAIADGGTGSYTYSYLIYNPGTKVWHRFNSTFTTKNTNTWTASGTGTRIFYAEVKDSTGKVVRSEAVNVKLGSANELAVNVVSNKYFTSVKDKITLTATGKGGRGSYTYSYLVWNTANDEWHRFSTFKSANTLSWTASSAGNRKFYAEIKDSTGKVVRSNPVKIVTR